MSFILLVNSLIVSFYLFLVLGSVWTSSVIVLMFSSGMMVLIIYVTSMSPTLNKSYYSWSFLLVVLVLFHVASGSSEFSMVYFMKDFTSSSSVFSIGLILMVSMIFMMENCHYPFSPVQSSF